MHLAFRLPFAFFLLALASSAHSADRTLATLPGGSAITTDDLAREVRRLSPQAQEQLLSRPPDVAQLVQSLTVRRELARLAEAEGLQDDPKVAAELRATRERVLAEAALERAEGRAPDRAALERLARNQYDAAPQKFDTPEQIRVSHILVGVKACDAEARAKELLALARQPGVDFAALAKANSDDPGSAARGGDLGFVARGKMTPAFDSAAFALKQPGDVSDVVKTEFGFHVIRLTERKPAGRQSFDAVRDGLVKSLAESEARTRRQQVVDKIAAGVQVDFAAVEAFVADPGAGIGKK